MNIDLVTIIVAAGFVLLVKIYLLWQYIVRRRNYIILSKPRFVVEVNKWEPDPLQSKIARQYSIARNRKTRFKRAVRQPTNLTHAKRTHSVIAATSDELQ